jgi:hypothetical protein
MVRPGGHGDFTGNFAGSGRGLCSGDDASVTVSDTAFTDNTASNHGGRLDNFGAATVTGSKFTANTAGSGNGTLNTEPGGLLTQSDNRFVDDLPPDVFP